MTAKDPEIQCGTCGAPIDEPSDTPPEKRAPCHACGSTQRFIKKELAEELHSHASLGFKAKRQGKGKPYLKGRGGDDLDRKTGKWMILERIIDRAKDWYKELVTDPETGNVVRHCEEPLSQHQGRGSAKKKTGSA